MSRLALALPLVSATMIVAACAPAAPAAAGKEASLRLGTAAVLTGATANVGTAPMIAIAPDGRRAAAWVSAPDGGTDGRLYVAVADAGGTLGAPGELRDSLGPIEPHGEAPPKIAFGADGALYALWVVGKEVPGRRFPLSALRFARSPDAGRTWSRPVSVTDTPQPFGSFNFHALHAAGGDTVYAAWLDGRDGKSAAYLTRSTDGGRTWQPNVRIDKGEACPCCRTAVATAGGDTVYAAWRHVAPGNVRAIVVARSTDGGRTFADPVPAQRDGWVIDGCPHAGPSLRVDAAGRVHVAWWTGKEGAAGVFYARSDDGGRTFGASVPLGVAEHSRPAHVQLALAGATGAEPRVVVAWDDGTVNVPRVLVRVSQDGGRRFASAVAASDEGGAATFPVLAASGGRLSMAWSQETPEHMAAEAHHRPNMKDPKARMPLPSVGQRQVIVREATID